MKFEKSEEDVLEELRQELLRWNSLFADSNVEVIQIDEKEKCEKCNTILENKLGNRIFVRCPQCNYLNWVTEYIRVPDFLGYLPWYYIQDKQGNVIKDYRGNNRLFEDEEAAREYLICSELNPVEYTIIKY